MTAPGWLALAAAVALLTVPAPATARAAALAGLGRLVPADGPHPPRPGAAVSWRRALAVLLAGLVGVVVAAGGPLLGLPAAAVCGSAWFLVRDAMQRRAAAGRHAQLLAALRILIGELEAGARPPVALTAAAEVGPAYAAVFAAASTAAVLSGDAGAALAQDPDTAAIALAWRLGEDAGLELSGVLTRVARDLSAEDEQRRSVAVALAGPRASAALLAGLPLLGIALGAAMGARPWDVLFDSTPGRAVCCIGVLLDLAGLLWMRRIIGRAERA